MKKILISLVIILLSSQSFGQIIDENTAQVVGYWNIGEKKELQIVKRKSKFKSGTIISNIASTSDVTIKVLKKVDENYLIEWICTKINIDGFHKDMKPIPSSITSSIIKLSEGMRVLFLVSDTGMFVSLENHEEIKNHCTNMINKLIENFPQKELKSYIKQKVLTLYQSKESIETFAIETTKLYYALHGLEYSKKENLTGDITLPNPLGGEPIPAKIIISLDKIDSRKDLVYFTYETKPDPEKMQRIMLKSMKKSMKNMSESLGKNSPEQIDELLKSLPKMVTTIIRKYEIFGQSGWVKSINSNRTTTSGDQKQIIEIIINLKK